MCIVHCHLEDKHLLYCNLHVYVLNDFLFIYLFCIDDKSTLL